jgi:hypothetical protein
MKLFIAAIGIVVLAGCAGYSPAIPSQALGLNLMLPNAAPAKCKTQKGTKEYATVAKQTIKEGTGSSVCVPAFNGWGGDLQFPGTVNDSYTISMTSSTTAYKGGSFPPRGSHKPIFYLQFAFDGFPGFYQTLPKGTPIESTHLAAGKPYSIEVEEYFYALGWAEVGECYQIAQKAKAGNGLADTGSLFENETFREPKGILLVFDGELVSNKC